jgi:DNA-binding CsgD family transcriptional regulator
MQGINLEKHYALSSSIHVKELFNELLASIGISYFNYIKIYNVDGSRDLLTNNPQWIDHFYKNALFNSVGAIDVEHLLPKGYFLWSELDVKDPIYLQGRDYFNIDHGISFVIKRADVTYLYIFAADQTQHQINNFYIRNIHLLKRFIHYFNDKAHTLIKNAEQHRIYLPTARSIDVNRVNNMIIAEERKHEFLQHTKVNRYFLLNEADELYLTLKQAEYAKLLIEGNTAKQIAHKMHVSYRTAEGYSEDLKNKLQDFFNKHLSKLELIEIIKSSNLV